MVAPIVEDHCGTVFSDGEEGVVGVGGDDSRSDCFFSDFLCGLGVGIGHTHCHPEFEGVGEAVPLCEVAEIDVVEFTEGVGTQSEIVGENGEDFIEFAEHLTIDLLLGVVGDGEAFAAVAADDFGVWNGTVHICHPVHYADTEEFRESLCHRIVGGGEDVAVVGIGPREDIGEGLVLPVDRRIVGLEFVCPGDCRSEVAGVRTGGKCLHELVEVLGSRHDKPLQALEGGAYDVALPLEFFAVHLVAFAVDFVKFSRAADGNESREDERR